MKSRASTRKKRQAVFRKAIAIVASVAMLTLVIPASFASNVASSTAGTPESAIASVEVPLDLGNGYIVYDGQTVAAPSTAITVPEGKDLVFSASADTGYDLVAVNMGLNGSTSELTRIADGTYTVGASNVENGLSITLVTTAQQSAAQNIAAVDITQSESQATQAENTKTVYTYEDDSVTVTATLQNANAVPDGAIFKVAPVTKETQGYNYDAYMTALNDQDNSSGEIHNDQNTLLYDIAFMYLGEEFEPASGSVKIDIQFKNSQLTNGIGTQDSQDVSVSHLALSDAKKGSVATTKDATNISSTDIKVETLSSEASIEGEQTASFTTDSFSVFSISSVGPKMSWQGTEALTSSRLMDGVGRANDYVVFAENLTNTDHIEGNVAVDNYYVGGGSASFDQLDNIYKQNILSGITVVKRVEGGLADGTFKFGIYDRGGSLLGTYDVTTSGGTGQTYVDVQANSTLKNAALNGALYVYELDGDRPLYTSGESSEGSYTVRYETLDGSTEVAGSQFSSAILSNYLGRVFLTDGNVNSSMNLNDIKGHVLPGNNNSLAVNYGDHPLGGAIELGEPYESAWGGQNRNELVIHAQNGTWYVNKEARSESPADYVTPVKNQTMVREYIDSVLKPFSAALARANSSKEGTNNGEAGGNTYVINIDGKAGSLARGLSAAGYTHVNDGAGFISGFKDGDFVVINIDCTGMAKFDIDNFIIDGKQSSGDYNNYFANHLVFNPVEKDASGNYVAYSGLVNLTGNYSGIMFAPGATIKCNNVLCGQLIGETVIRGGSEIHKKTMTDGTAIEHSAEVTIVNSKKGVSGNLIVTKAFGEGSLISAANLSDAQKAAITFTVTGPNNFSRTFTYADMQDGSITLPNLAVGEYTVTETNADVDGYTAQTSYSVDAGKTTVIDAQTSQITVTNTYRADTSAHLALSAYKSLEGKDAQLKAGDFTFTVTENGQIVAEGSNDATGLVTFGDIKYSEPGEHNYVISETNSHKSGYTYDTKTYKAHVSVSAGADGKLVATVTYDTADGKAPTFVNTYENNKQNQIRVMANKTLNGQTTMKAGTFTFNLKDWSGKVIATATNDANGSVTFPLFDYDGNYTWNNSLFMTEEIPDEAVNPSGKTYGEVKATDNRLDGPFVLNGVSYDSSEYLVKIVNVNYKPWPNNNEIASYEVKFQQVTGYAWGNRQYNSPAKTTPPTFGNMSTLDTKGSLKVTKTIAGDASVDTLTTAQKQAIVFTVTGPNGYSTSFTYADMEDGSKTLDELEIGDYTVTEDAQGSVVAGYTLAVEGNGSVASVRAGSTAQLALTNTYTYDASGTAHIDVQKSYAGAYPAAGFGFTLTGIDGAPVPGGGQTASVTVSNGDAASFGDIAFTISDIADGVVLNGRLMKEFTYEVSEDLPDGVTAENPTKDGITYDAASHAVKVMVWDKGDGTLGTAVDYGAQNAQSVAISNTYAARGHVDLEGSKTLVGHALDAGIAAGFTYEILDEQGNRVGLGATNADGIIAYDSIDYYLNADRNDVGQHVYTVREIMPEGLSYDEATGKWAGSSCYLYDGTNHTVTVDVTDNANGTLSAAVVSVDGSSSLKTLDFENAYRASGSATITATKELLGRALKAGEFSFELKDANGRVLQTVQNDKNGAVTFKPIQYSLSDLENATQAADGSYEFAYTISEKAGSAGGVSYSDALVKVTVKVTDDGNGTLSAVVGYASEQGAVFTNTYSARGTTTVAVTKDYNNWANAGDGFDFTIAAEEGAPLPEKTTVTATQQNKTPSFGTIAFTSADLEGGTLVNGKLTKSFSYVISEVAPAAVYNGVTYDTTPRVLTVTATDNGDGTITCAQSVTKDGVSSELRFANTYGARGSVILQGEKSMEGRNLAADDSFSFTITPTDQSGNAIEGAHTYQASSTGANGVISYPQIFYTLDDMANADGSYASSKTFYYTVTENIPDDATITTASGEKVAYKDATDEQKKAGGFSKNGISYSTTPQKFTVTVTDTGIGVLSTEAKLVDGTSAGANALNAASSNTSGNAASRSSSGLPRFATNLNGNYDSTVTTTISGVPVPEQTGKTFDIVFVVDTSASQGNTAEALMNKMLAEAEAGGYKVNIGIVKYYYVAKVVRNLDGSAGWNGSGKTNGTNLPAGILLGTKMLDDDTNVANENKYLVVLSDGDTYIYQDDNQLNSYYDKGVLRTVGDDAMVVTQMDSDYTNVPFAGPGSYSWKYFNGNKEPDSFAAPADWDQFFARVASQVQADNGAYETKWDWHTNNLYSGTTNAIPENEVANHAVSSDTSLYYSLIDYQAAAAKYHTYATFVGGGFDRPYGESFMAYLNGGESFDMAKLEEQLLSDIQGAAHGGEIVDTIGSGYDDHGNAYDIDLVNSIDTTDIVYNGVTLDKRVNTDGTFSFGTSVNGVFDELFKFTYTPAIETGGNETASDNYTVTFSDAVSSTDTIQLRYNVHLANPQTASGTYGNYDADGSRSIEGLLVSSHATLNRGGSSQVFANPVVSYSALGFVNKYDASGSAMLLGTKAMEGRSFKSGDRFTFTVTADDGGALPSKPTVAVDGSSLSGQTSAALEFGSFTFGLADAGKTYHYTITETGSAAGVTLAAPQQVTVTIGQDTGTGELDVSVTPNMGGLSFVNTYEASAELRFAGTKRMEGRAITDNDRFTFDISENGETIATATSVGSTISFPTLSYTLDDLGTHTYTVSEQAYNSAGITSDTRSYEVNVNVADNGDGTLRVTASDNAKALDFVNKYTSVGSIAINGTKNMIGRAFTQGDSFTFTLSARDGAPLPAQTSTTITPSSGTSASFTFDAIEYTQADAGRTYTYEVRETAGADTALSYDTRVRVVSVYVADDGAGNVTASIVSDSSDAVEFTNTYSASGSIALSANKELTGRALAAGEFSFELRDANGSVLQTKTNSADGTVSFDAIDYTLDDLAANADGTYGPAEKVYTISEVAGPDANIAYDAHSETVRVALSDAGNGTISAAADKTGLAVTFSNKVEDVTVSGTKTWSDAGLSGAPRPSSITVNLLANGVEIDEQNVTAANNWNYSFTGLPRYAADGTEIVYTVTEDAVAGYVGSVEGSNITNAPIEPGEIRFAGTKSFAGQDDGQFTFTVRENGATVATGTNKADGSIEFTPITYTYRDVGTHVYTIAEENTGQTIDGITYDATSYEVTVDVAIDGTRLVITPSSNYNALSFVNTYAASGSMTFEGVKRMEGRAMTAADVYDFTVSEVGTANTWTASNVAQNGATSGAIVYPTIEYTLADVGEHSYMVTENAPSQGGVTVQTMGYRVTVSVTDNGDGTLAVTPTRESADPAKLDFTNLYTATGSITFAGTKSLTGRALAEGDTFVFDVKDTTPGSAGTTWNVTNSGATINYPTINYTQADAGRHTYTVTERSMATGGVTSSGQSYDVAVDVVDNGDGTLGVVASDNARSLDFVNTYEASGSTELTGYKSIEGRSFASGDSATLTVSAPAGTPMPQKTQIDISPTGSTSVPVDFGAIEYSVENAGQTYVYTVSETVNGMAGTQTAVNQTVSVTVSDKGNGQLDVVKTSNSGANFNLVNVYNATGSATLSATKSLTGRDWGTAESFSFMLSGVDGAPMPAAGGENATATAAARTADFGVINYTVSDAGKTYTYAITENVPAGVSASSPTQNGVTYDLSTHTASVTVTDNGDGTLSTQVVYDGAYNTAPVFANVYTTTEAIAHLSARKELTGATLQGGEFSFALAGTSANAASTQMVASNAADGSVTFGNIVFTEPGTYEYRISEVAGDSAAYKYDSNVHRATIIVSDNGLGQLVVDSIGYDSNGASEPTFTNAFFEARAPLSFTKYYFGSLAASFEFDLVETDANWRALTGNKAYSETVSNGAFDADGVASVEFSELVYHEPGDHYYTVQEKKKGGFVTDDVVYRVHVKVGDDMSVTRTCQMFYDGETYDIDYADASFFNNNAVSLGFNALSAMSAGAAGAATDIYPTVRKTLDGTTAALHEGEFSFLLSDEKGSVVAIGTNDANGQVAFFQEGEGGLWFTADDVGTHKYTITELNDDIVGMNFDSKTIGYTVTVTQNGDGSLSTTEVYDVNGVEVDDPTFENTTEGINVRVQKVSRMGGEGLDVCTYGLWLANAEGADVLIQEATSDATGWIVFDNARLQQGELYYFKEVEAPTGHKVDPYRSAYVTLDPTGSYLVLAEDTVDGLHAVGNEGE